jgi:hypothetical protein
MKSEREQNELGAALPALGIVIIEQYVSGIQKSLTLVFGKDMCRLMA